MATASPPARNGNGHAQPPAPRRDFLAMLEQSREGVASLIPDPAKVDRVLRLVRTAYQTDGGVRSCEPTSIVASAIKACELGLDPCGARKHCYLIPYKGQCTLQVSYMGMLELAHRSGVFAAIEARTVHQGDAFHVEYNPEPIFRHVPGGATDDRSLTHVYAYARLKSGGIVIEVLTRDEVEKVRAAAQSNKVWGPWYGEMAKKTAIKRLLKRQPSSVELAEAIEHDNGQYGDAPPPRGDGATASARLASRLAPALPAPEDESQDTGPAPESVSQDDNESWDDGVAPNG